MLKNIVEFIFSFALFINALLFIPQAVRIFREKAAEEVSLLTFLGFLLIQFAIVLHGIINRDYLLVVGYLFSMLTCGVVVSLIVIYNKLRALRGNIDSKEILKQLPGHVYCKNKAGIYLDSNTNNWKDIGLESLSELKGKTDYDLFSTQEADRLRAVDEAVMRTGLLKIVEEEIQTHSGIAYYLSHKIPLRNKKNQIVGILGVSIDITDAKKETTEKFEILEKIIAMMPGHVYWVNREGFYLGCNDNQAKSAGLNSRQEIVGKRNQDLPWNFNAGVLPETLDKINKEVIETRKPITIEESAILYDGTEATFLSNKVPIYNGGGNAIGMVGISIDITDRKKMELDLKDAKEKAEAANKAKSDFITEMSHDVRTPLAGMIGMSEILEKVGDTKKDREAAHIIHESGDRLLDLLNNILLLISADKIHDIKLETLSLKKMIKDLRGLILPNLRLENIEFKINIDPNFPEYIVSDRLKIVRILLNLVSNSLKFTEQGSINLNLNVLSSDTQQVMSELTISDTGIGIPKDKIDKIFDRFFRVSPSYEGKYKGYGIGLSIVQKFVSMLGGKIMVESELGKGTKFTIHLPIKIGRPQDVTSNNVGIEPPIALSNFKSKPTMIDNTKKRIQKTNSSNDSFRKALVVEDDAVARRIVKSFLQSAGFKVDDVEDAETGFDLVIHNAYDLIITDIGLPGMNGYEFTTLTRSWEKATHHLPLPIIGLSAQVQANQEESTLAGMNILLTKPANEEKIKVIIDKFFSDKERAKRVKQQPDNKKTMGLGMDLPDTEGELFQIDQYPLFDEKDGIEKVGNSLEMLKELIHILVDETLPEELANIEKAHGISDWETIQKLAHKLKGGALYCGTIRMRYACQYVERYQLAGHDKLQEELYQQLIDVLKNTHDHLVSWLSN